MALNMNLVAPGREDSWPTSPPYVDFHDPFTTASLAYHPAKSLCLDTEPSPGRPEPAAPVPVPMTPSSPESWQQHQTQLQLQSQPQPHPEEHHLDTSSSSSASSPDIIQTWYPQYLACTQYFLTHSQHTPAVQSLAAFLNIRLPCQRASSSSSSSSASSEPFPTISLQPYIRRLIVTANDSPAVLDAFFGTGWPAGVGRMVQEERQNYLFTAKSGGWAATKAAYDILPDEQAPFLRPLRNPDEDELRRAEARWSEWLAMEDWMVGARSPW
ncbi:hypothetical protein BO70DRAFT_357944 [Aspergillus heteromorphus CBS 117.55]|uniref:Ilp is an apoptosis inhibitor n=1 Tax=Aspergillus heteromorphus CBS 117.55 TaxID=1448321 RepID=A0A317X5I5_9EURO|nr:uncharacterized protein BO70DRAFT_357944 [Aspergillus heteromorphus CBS 117.55]PWY92807.1 hypothetical protein BO70DRAFT_357944 [Aspergillus heteromorphus CBS 117.55]